ncbi:hypothetical protein JS532_08825 [Bifidobacterium callimiconis]|uniref:hypothetical protein n=1 Tax=Bifidobacterium callimiconis TaxID=2306973 RepID=UPI001BDC2395|nr:hypothetical protein [Bifidobacterium callimiconis]MBT1177658.1 hypothetical protein [Bifidobacterium callimiconis]
MQSQAMSPQSGMAQFPASQFAAIAPAATSPYPDAAATAQGPSTRRGRHTDAAASLVPSAVSAPASPQSASQSASQSARQSSQALSRPRARSRSTAVGPPLSSSSFLSAPGGPGSGIVMFLSSSGGVGATVLTALCAWHLTMRNRTCALVDADFTAGGMDVTLGIETEPGMRWSSVSAPLGRIEPRSLLHELPEWEETVVLAADPWNDLAPDWWEVDAAMRALTEACEIVLVDGGHADSEHTLRMHAGVRVVVVELSVLGLARARGLLMRLKESRGSGGGKHGGGRHGGGNRGGGVRGAGGHGSGGRHGSGNGRSGPGGGARHGGPRPGGTGNAVGLAGADIPTLLVGIKPASAPRSGVVAVEEAEEYLGSPLIAVFTHDRSISRSVLSGTGIPSVPRRYRRSLDALCDRLEMECRNE